MRTRIFLGEYALPGDWPGSCQKLGATCWMLPDAECYRLDVLDTGFQCLDGIQWMPPYWTPAIRCNRIGSSDSDFLSKVYEF